MIYWQTKNWQKSFNFPKISQAFASSPPCDWLPPDKNNGQKLLLRSSTVFQSETSLLSNPSNIRRGAKVSCKLPILIWRGIDGWTLGLARHRALYWSWLISLSLSPSLSPDFNCYGQHYSKQCFPCTPYLQRLAQHIIYENGVLSSLRLLQQLDRNFFRESKLTPRTHFRSEWGL